MLGPAALTAGLAAGALTSGLALYAWHLRTMLIAQIGLTVIAWPSSPPPWGFAGPAVSPSRVWCGAAAPLGLALVAALPAGRRTLPGAGAAAGVAAWSLLLLTLTDRWVLLTAAMTAVSIPVALVAACYTVGPGRF